MLKLDHISVIAPSLAEGLAHVRACLDLDVPFGQRHAYMGTYNHLLQLGDTVYLEIVALDPEADGPGRPRWFGLDDQKKVRSDWDEGRRLRGWVARTDAIDTIIAGRRDIFGEKVPLPAVNSSFDFAIPDDGSLPLDGAAPSLSTGEASLARWPQLPIWVHDCDRSLSNIRIRFREGCVSRRDYGPPACSRSRSQASLSCADRHANWTRELT